MGFIGIFLGLALLILLAYRGWSVLLVGPLAALLAAAFAREPLLASWTLTFMRSASGFITQFFPLFLLGALFGKLMDDSGSALAIARALTGRLGRERAILAVVLACAMLTYGGVSLFVVAFVVVPVADALFREADVPHRLIPATVALGAFSFTMTALPGTPAIQNAIPMPYFGTNAFAAPGLGLIAAAVMLGFGLWWLGRAEAAARRAGEGYRPPATVPVAADDQTMREHAVIADTFDPSEIPHGRHADEGPPFWQALLPMLVVVVVNFAMSTLILPRLDWTFLAEEQWGPTSLAAVGGIWSVATALLAATVVLVLLNRKHLPSLRETMDAGANASVLPVMNTATMVGFGGVIAALPAFAGIRDALLAVPGGPLISIAVATNVVAGFTGSASGGLMITLNSLGETYMQTALAAGINPALMHRVAAIGCGGLSSLPHNGAVVTLLAICGATHSTSYRDIAMVMLVGTLLALAVIIPLGTAIGTF
jgi:H+/gluconate symporter-like permease